MFKINFNLFFVLFLNFDIFYCEIVISNSTECKEDINKYCSLYKSANNLQLLICFHNNVPENTELSHDCQNILWQAKNQLFNSSNQLSPCQQEVQEISECRNEYEKGRLAIACLADNINLIKEEKCLNFLNHVLHILFSDYRIVYKLVDKCHEDISKFKCGRHANLKNELKDQGSTIGCLYEKIDKLDSLCKQEVLKIAQLQSKDWNNDRPLFQACLDDKERFCQHILPGKGLIYSCLTQHKMHPDMSQMCREKLTLRQKLSNENPSINHIFFIKCEESMKKYNCEEYKTLQEIISCLDKQQYQGNLISRDCLKEMREIKKEFLDDPQLTPKIMKNCNKEISICSNQNQLNKIYNKLNLPNSSFPSPVFCLMDLARRSFTSSSFSIFFSSQCFNSIKNLLEEIDVFDDSSFDSALIQACGSSIKSHCSLSSQMTIGIIDCLMENLGKIEDFECENRIMEIYFFLSRDFRLSKKFWFSCEPDAKKFCSSLKTKHGINQEKEGEEEEEEEGKVAGENKEKENEEDKHDEEKNEEQQKKNNKSIKKTSSIQSHVLSCLYRNKQQISMNCKQRLVSLMKKRAHSVDLPSNVQDNCIPDLGKYCKDYKQVNEEMKCLEDNMENLTPECRDEVEEEIENEEEIPQLTKIFLDACDPVMHDLCRKFLYDKNENKNDEEQAANDEGMMKCLIENKHSNLMPHKCKVGIEHHQIITMKNMKLNKRFMKNCNEDLIKYCPSKHNFEQAICLSEHVFNDTMLNKELRISNNCHVVLSFFLLQTRENIRLDLNLKESCNNDVQRLCGSVKPGKGAIIFCLQRNQEELSDKCRAVVFRRELVESIIPSIDYKLQKTCLPMIEKFCSNDESDLFYCLKKFLFDFDFEEKCKKVVIQKMRIQAKDIRLNPRLKNDCWRDIVINCRKELDHVINTTYDYEGKIIYCLKRTFIHMNKGKKMAKSCQNQMLGLLREASWDTFQDVQLIHMCKSAINESCIEEITRDKMNMEGSEPQTLKCLEENFFNHQQFRIKHPKCLQEVIRRINEEKVDIQVDPLLQKQCAVDLQVLCPGIPQGGGKKLSCLVLKKDDASMSRDCKKALLDRISLWENSFKLAPPETMNEMYSHLSSSTIWNKILLVLFFLFFIMFLVGLFLGRLSRKARYQLLKER